MFRAMNGRFVTVGWLRVERHDDETLVIMSYRNKRIRMVEVKLGHVSLHVREAGTLAELHLYMGTKTADVMASASSTPEALLAQIIDSLRRINCSAATIDRLVDLDVRRHERGENKKMNVLTSDIEALMEAVDRCRGEIVPCLLGSPGIGKTEGIESFARKHGRNVVHIIASQVLPSEISGMTMPNQETHSMDVFDHARLSHMRDGDVLFLDEILKGQQQVLSAMLTLVQERRLMSGTRLPDIIVVAAANELASPKMLPLEIRQRFLFVNVDFDFDSWCDYMRERGIQRPEEMEGVIDCNPDSSSWNAATPRTATKMLLWMKSVAGDAELTKMVRQVIMRELGTSFMSAVTLSLGNADKTVMSAMDQTRSVIGRLVRERRDLIDDEQVDLVIDELEKEDDEMDVQRLLSLISEMSCGSEIMKALERETIELNF